MSEFGPFHAGKGVCEDSIYDEESNLVADVYGKEGDGSEVEIARLFAAAPEMLDALTALTDPEGHIWHGPSGECTEECKAVRAAIAKARGES